MGLPRHPATFHAVRAANGLRRQIRSNTLLFLLLAIGVGAAASLAAIAIGQSARGMQRVLFGLAVGEHLSAASHVAPLRLLALPIGGALLGCTLWLLRRRKTIDVVEANALHGGRIPARDTATVVGQTLLSNGFGASVGLEAAYAQAGGGLASLLGQRLKLRRADLRTLMAAGAGAGLGAAFGAPLTGAFYAFEIVLGAYTPAIVAPVVLASLTAATIARTLGIHPYVISAGGGHPIGTADYALYALLGVVCAGFGIALMRLVALVEAGVRRSPIRPAWAPLIGGLLMIPLALLSPQVLSSGHGALDINLAATATLASLGVVILLKLLGSAVSLGFGFRGGLFFASLFLGALIGRFYQLTLAEIPGLHHLAPDDAAVVGMAALAVAVVGGPMTMSLLVLEVTHDFSITGVTIAATLIASTIVREAFGYSFSTWRLHLRGETLRSGRDVGWVRALTAARMMRRDVATIAADTDVAAFRDRFPLGSTKRVVLLDAKGHYAGIAETAAVWSPSADQADRVISMAKFVDTALSPDMTIAEVLEAFDASVADDLAVLSSDGQVLGLITESHARRRYAEELEKAQRDLYGES
ncbi:chloride channel protein, CIC family [Sphingomonas sp. NFR04]|uniref:chloride channel protein n=1 Tax=Sphingomonas sp. NFR04 TaxID=1566283 RepID=UPI0008F3429A|nr:chloride channel protein [Sphingomonas sp. NFR04]SFI97532.1 chloride channel protein, CIC family [Sphingomonas sp. NFR04]